jgi:hypothetical protein
MSPAFLGILAGGFSGQVYAAVKRQFSVVEKLASAKIQSTLGSTTTTPTALNKTASSSPDLPKSEDVPITPSDEESKGS